MPVFVLRPFHPATGRPEVGVSEGGNRAASPPQGVVTVGICYWLFVFARCRRRPARYAPRSPLPVRHVLSTYHLQRRLSESPFLGFLSNFWPSTDDCPPRGQEPSASSYPHLERGFINRSKLPFRAYYSPFVNR